MAELRKIQQQLGFCGAGCHGAEDITDREPGTPDTWLTKAHGWVDRDAFKHVHTPNLGTAGPLWEMTEKAALPPERPCPAGPEQQPGQNQQPKGKGPKGSRTKKGTWGRGTARTQTDAGEDVVRAAAEPEGGAGVAGIDEPRAPAQQQVTLFLVALQSWV